MLEIAACVIAGAEVELQVRSIHGDFQVAEPAVLQLVITAEAENVVDGTIFLNLRKDAAEIVGIEESFSAGVRGKRCQGVLRSGVAVQIIQDGRAGIRGLTVQAGVLRFAARRKRLQSANVQRVNGSVGFDSSGGGGAESGLIVHAGLGDAVAEIDDAFLLRQL